MDGWYKRKAPSPTSITRVLVITLLIVAVHD